MPTFFSRIFNREPNFQNVSINSIAKTDDHLKSELLDNFDTEVAQMFAPIKIKSQHHIENLTSIELSKLNSLLDEELNRIAKVSTKLRENKLLQNLFSIGYDFSISNNEINSNFKFELKGNTIQWSIIFTKSILTWLKVEWGNTNILKCELEGKGSREKEIYYLNLNHGSMITNIAIQNTNRDELFDGLN